MKLSGIQIGLCVSLLFHSLVFSAVYVVRRASANAMSDAGFRDTGTMLVIVESDPAPTPAAPAPPENIALQRIQEPAPPDPEPTAPALDALPTPEGPAVSPAVADKTEMPSAAQTTVQTSGDSSARPVAASTEASPPGYLLNPKPAYPKEARQRRQHGLVVLNVSIDGTGNPQRVDVVQSSGYLLLDQAAKSAVEHWQFSPGHAGPIALASDLEVPIRFKLSN